MLSVAIRVARGARVFSLNATMTKGFTALCGPSGSGKSSLLLGLAGVLATTGRATLGSVNWVDDAQTTAPEARDLAVAFQHPLLFPHLSVTANVQFGLFGIEQSIQEARVSAALASCEASHLRLRRVAELSGGEAQRVSLARAIARRSKVLLLDEPFAALDRDLRSRIAKTLTLHVETHNTIVVLTAHDETPHLPQDAQIIAVSAAN